MSITDVLTNPLDILKGEVPSPQYKVVIDGTDITNKIKPRLMNLTLTDNRGFDADQVELQLTTVAHHAASGCNHARLAWVEGITTDRQRQFHR